jgi:hypothetical protein
MNQVTFERIANEALSEHLDELRYPKRNRWCLCGWFDFPESVSEQASAQDRERNEREFCAEYADGRQDLFPVWVLKTLNESDAKNEIKRQLRGHGLTPGLGYVRPEE